MGNSRDIKKRMRAVSNIKRITRTMQMIATSKFAKAQQASQATRPYTDALFGLVAQLSGAGVGENHPLLAERDLDTTHEQTLVLTAERGLCGPYNGSVVRTALAHLRENQGAAQGPIDVVGKKGAGTLRFNGYRDFTHHTHFGETPRFEDIERLAQSYIDAYAAGKIAAVRVVYMKYISVGKQRPEVLQLLPFQTPEIEGDDAGAAGFSDVYEFSPDAESLLDHLLPAAVKSTLFQCFNDAVVSEHIARMIAMQAATDNAGKMGQALKRQFNRARQAQITTELTEIISGVAALEN